MSKKPGGKQKTLDFFLKPKQSTSTSNASVPVPKTQNQHPKQPQVVAASSAKPIPKTPVAKKDAGNSSFMPSSSHSVKSVHSASSVASRETPPTSDIVDIDMVEDDSEEENFKPVRIDIRLYVLIGLIISLLLDTT